MLLENRFPLKVKVYCRIRSAVLHGSNAWCLKEHVKAILRGTERAVVRAMGGRKVVDKKRLRTNGYAQVIKETINGLAKGSGVWWYKDVLRRDDDSVV